MSLDPARLHILNFPHPVLRQKARPVERFDDDLRRLAERMFDLMHEAEGIGLAAPQVGVSRRLFVVDAHQGEPPMVYINPELSEYAEEFEVNEEGCLSLPGIRGEIRRPAAVTIHAQDLEGNRFTRRAADLTARVWQHEFDHLNGVMIIDKMTMRDRLANRRAIRDLEALGSGS